MEIGYYEEHGRIFKFRFNLPRKLKKIMKQKIGCCWQEYKDSVSMKFAHSIKERHF